MSEKIEIPEKYQAFCREMASVAARMGVDRAEVKLYPAYDDEWNGVITAKWERGRHGSQSHRICVTSEVRVHTDLSGDPKGFHR
jgi:hypothetical protein